MLEALDREAVAALANNRAYRLLMKEMEEGLNDILALMHNAKEDQEVLRYCRLWQVFFHYWQILRDAPHRMQEELEREIKEVRAAAQYTTNDPHAPPFSLARAQTLQQLEQLVAQGQSKELL